MPNITPLVDRFHAKYERVPFSGCWVWTGSVTGKGYGHISNKGVDFGAHRTSWELHRGPIPKGMKVLHRCDTPPCVNPDHLWLGTLSDNSLDMYKKNRKATLKQLYGSARTALTREQVQAIRERYSKGYSQTQVSKEYGVSQTHVGLIVRHKVWSWLS